MFLKNLDGKTIVLEPTIVVPSATVRVLKDVVEAQVGILPEDQRLSFGGNLMFYFAESRELCTIFYCIT